MGARERLVMLARWVQRSQLWLAAGALVLPGLHQNVNAVTTVTLRKGDGTHATLQKDGSVWRVQERGWTADVGKVRKLLLDLGSLNIVEEKTRLPANYPQLGVEDVSSPKATGTPVSGCDGLHEARKRESNGAPGADCSIAVTAVGSSTCDRMASQHFASAEPAGGGIHARAPSSTRASSTAVRCSRRFARVHPT